MTNKEPLLRKPIKEMTSEERKAYHRERQKAYRLRQYATPETRAAYLERLRRATAKWREKILADPERAVDLKNKEKERQRRYKERKKERNDRT
jgi:hypothetical protein